MFQKILKQIDDLERINKHGMTDEDQLKFISEGLGVSERSHLTRNLGLEKIQPIKSHYKYPWMNNQK